MSSSRVVPSEPDRLTALQCACLLAAVVACRLLATRACPIYDDAFITYRYARNLAEGAGLVFNPGEPWEPVLGTTTPFYALLLAGLAALGADLVRASLTVNIACDVLSAGLILRAFRGRPLPGTIAVLAFAGLPQIARISIGGMESPLFALFGLAAATALATGRPMRAGLFAALNCTVRPEGLLLVGILCLERLRRPRDLARILLPVALIGIASMGLLAWVYGDVIPQSVHAKTALHSAEGIGEVLRRWKSILVQSFAPGAVCIVFLPVVAIGTIRILRTPGTARTFSLFALAITASYLAARPHIWGWYFYVPLVAWVIWLATGIERLVELRGAGSPAEVPGPALLRRAERWLTAPVQRLVVAPLERWLVAPLGRLAGARASARVRTAVVPALAAATTVAVAAAVLKFPSPVPARVYEPMQRWAQATSKLHPRAKILAADIGAIGYAWEGTVLDSEGLTWPQALRFVHPNAILEEMLPEYFLVVAEQPRLRHFYGKPEIKQQYVPIARFSVSGASVIEPELDTASPVWVQDYVLYQRHDF